MSAPAFELNGQDGCEPSEEERERATQLTAQTAPVTERKHFYRTARSTRKVQDVLLATDDSMEDVNGAFVLGAACAVMQTTAARCGMLTKDSYDGKSVRWWMRTRCACSTDRNNSHKLNSWLCIGLHPWRRPEKPAQWPPLTSDRRRSAA